MIAGGPSTPFAYLFFAIHFSTGGRALALGMANPIP